MEPIKKAEYFVHSLSSAVFLLLWVTISQKIIGISSRFSDISNYCKITDQAKYLVFRHNQPEPDIVRVS